MIDTATLHEATIDTHQPVIEATRSKTTYLVVTPAEVAIVKASTVGERNALMIAMDIRNPFSDSWAAITVSTDGVVTVVGPDAELRVKALRMVSADRTLKGQLR
jgi:hypothetical protein